MTDLALAAAQLLTLALLVGLATVPSLARCHRLRRLVPGMSWRCAWRLTAPEDPR